MNCIQNQVTIAEPQLLIRNKVAAFIITGGQDNVQAVAGQMLTFFAELGCQFPQFPFIAHSRGWTAEDMENNAPTSRKAKSCTTARGRSSSGRSTWRNCWSPARYRRSPMVGGGRKGHQLDVKAQT